MSAAPQGLELTICALVHGQLFMDMAILVETQGDLIDQIEFSVMNSKAFTEKAVDTLHQTEKIVINTRKVNKSPYVPDLARANYLMPSPTHRKKYAWSSQLF